MVPVSYFFFVAILPFATWFTVFAKGVFTIVRNLFILYRYEHEKFSKSHLFNQAAFLINDLISCHRDADFFRNGQIINYLASMLSPKMFLLSHLNRSFSYISACINWSQSILGLLSEKMFLII